MLPVLSGSEAGPRALVLVPTRGTLALQVENEASRLFEGTGVSCVALYGGVGYKKQLDGLEGGAQLIIFGTPGRILDQILRHSLDLFRHPTPLSSLTKLTACSPSVSTPI